MEVTTTLSFNATTAWRHALFLLCLLLIPTGVAADAHQPAKADIQKAVQQAHDKFKGNRDGKNASYIPALAKVPSQLYGVAVVTVNGDVIETGDSGYEFAIESASKPFTAALVAEQQGIDVLPSKIGVNATGLPFNSVIAIELEPARTVNPLVNAGAIATVSLLQPKGDFDAKWKAILDNMSAFAGRSLSVNEPVYKSEMDTNQHNRAIATLLQSYDHMWDEPTKSTEVYTRQCSVNVTARDLATMAATLANGGTNPVTGKRVVSPEVVRHILAVMATAGLYDSTGQWLWLVGLPGKSGVGGGIIAVAPGKMGIGAFAPPLDEAGNSVKGQMAAKFLSETLGLNLFKSEPAGS
ncbi:glutaminase A [Microbulbifer sp. TYP-18]|uniref:glutaminase A n=1 Tax=Microbulbifer sp. TYP-18 TaxID=3230024 RepID=UPI0034C6A4ED